MESPECVESQGGHVVARLLLHIDTLFFHEVFARLKLSAPLL